MTYEHVLEARRVPNSVQRNLSSYLHLHLCPVWPSSMLIFFSILDDALLTRRYKLLTDVPAPRSRDDHVLRGRCAPPACRPQTRVHVPLRQPARRKTCIWVKDRIYVRVFLAEASRLVQIIGPDHDVEHYRFVGVLFVDALQRMFRITAEADAAKAGGASAAHDVRAETNFAARKF